jgi:hypothetical protein
MGNISSKEWEEELEKARLREEQRPRMFYVSQRLFSMPLNRGEKAKEPILTYVVVDKYPTRVVMWYPSEDSDTSAGENNQFLFPIVWPDKEQWDAISISDAKIISVSRFGEIPDRLRTVVFHSFPRSRDIGKKEFATVLSLSSNFGNQGRMSLMLPMEIVSLVNHQFDIPVIVRPRPWVSEEYRRA